MESTITPSYQVQDSPAQLSKEQFDVTDKHATMIDFTSEHLFGCNESITHLPNLSRTSHGEQSSQKPETIYSTTIIKSQGSRPSTTLSQSSGNKSSCSSTLISNHRRRIFGAPNPPHVFGHTSGFAVPDENRYLEQRSQTIASEAKSAILSCTVGQESLVCSESIVTSTLHNKQRPSSSIPRVATSSDTCANSSKVVHHGEEGTSTPNEHFTQLFPLSKSLPDHLILPFNNLPPHDEPPPDSDIAQLWEEVKERVANMCDPSEKLCQINTAPTAVGKSSRKSDQLFDYDIRVYQTCLPTNENFHKYLEVESITGDPQFATILKERFEAKHYRYGTNTFYHKLTTALLSYDPHSNGCLRDSTKTQGSQVNTQQDPDAPVLPDLSHLDFISKPNCSEGFNECSFSLDVRNTLSNMKQWPSIATTVIPSTVISETRIGPTFLHLHCQQQASANISMKWQVHAHDELVKQLRLHRVGLTVDERLTLASTLRHFGYLMTGSKLELWQMKVRTKYLRDPNSNTSTSTMRSENGFSVPARRPGVTHPYILPCERRMLRSFDFKNGLERKEFYDANNAIMKWGQAKYAMTFMENLHLLLDLEKCDQWLMSGEELKQYWDDIVVFRGAEMNNSL